MACETMFLHIYSPRKRFDVPLLFILFHAIS